MLSKNGRGMPLQGAISGLPAWQGRSAGVYFCPGKNTRKTRLGLSPLGTPLGVRDWMCVKSMVGPGLVPVQENSYSLQRAQPDQSCAASPPGPMPVAMQPFPAAGNSRNARKRPGRGSYPAIGPAADGLAPGGGNAASPGQARRWKSPGHRASCPGWPGVVAQTGATARVTGRTPA